MMPLPQQSNTDITSRLLQLLQLNPQLSNSIAQFAPGITNPSMGVTPLASPLFQVPMRESTINSAFPAMRRLMFRNPFGERPFRGYADVIATAPGEAKIDALKLMRGQQYPSSLTDPGRGTDPETVKRVLGSILEKLASEGRSTVLAEPASASRARLFNRIASRLDDEYSGLAKLKMMTDPYTPNFVGRGGSAGDMLRGGNPLLP